MRLQTSIGITLIFLFSSSLAFPAADGPEELLFLENKYIKIFVNNTGEETGRFAVDVSNGDPERRDDDNKPLIYGHPKPWTSFTTLRIDGENYVFGPSSPKRAGARLPGGEILEAPKLSQNQLTMKCRYGPVVVEQILDITRSPSTGALDTARIKYLVNNQGSAPVEIGLRTLLDTMVGDNDGAPFRFGEKEVTYEYSGNHTEFPDFWQAFDSLAKPSVIAQGTLKGGDVVTPDRLVFTNWGKAADNPWEFPVEAGTELVRLGEDELDSAIVMYWLPRKITPGGRFTVVVDYGLGGITFSPGNTFLGISAPAEVRYSIDEQRNYSIILYLEHRGEAKAREVKIALELPTGLECTAGHPKISLPELMPGVTKQFLWEIKPNGKEQGETGFRIKVTGAGLEANQVSRKLKIVGPPFLSATMVLPTLKVVKNKWEPYPVNLTVKIINKGEAPAYNLKANLAESSGIKLIEGERAEKFLSDLDPKAETEAVWQITPAGELETAHLKIDLSAFGAAPVALTGKLAVPELPVKVKFSDLPEKLKPGQVLCCEILAVNLKEAQKFSFDVKFNPEQARLVYVSRGFFLVEGEEFSQWSSGAIDNKKGRVINISGSRSWPFYGGDTTLARLNFILRKAGEGAIEIENLKIEDSAGKEIQYQYTSAKYQIEEVKNEKSPD